MLNKEAEGETREGNSHWARDIPRPQGLRGASAVFLAISEVDEAVEMS